MKTIYSGPCHVTIMSPEGVDIFEIGEHTPEEAHYKFLGFPEPNRSVEVIDYRPAGIRALEYALRTEDVDKFAGEFGATAFVLISQDGESYQVELRDIPAGGPADPPQRLWLVNGLDDSLPTYDYRVCELAAPDEEHFACLAVYDIPRWHKPRRRSSKVVGPVAPAGRGLRRRLCASSA